jgi:ribonuclease T2
MGKLAVRVALGVAVAAVAVSAAAPVLAQDAAENVPGDFDYYVLALSWSPSFCAAAAEHGGRSNGQQCGARPYSFVVHGLWPQYERGFPEYCQDPPPRLDHRIVSAMLDLMPAPHLIYNEWDKHGTCSGLSQQAYFDTVRKARAAVKIPPDYADPQQPLTVAPDAVKDAFIKANSGLSQDEFAVTCDRRRLTGIRLCLAKDLTFHACPDVARRGCRRDQVVMPPLRGG